MNSFFRLKFDIRQDMILLKNLVNQDKSVLPESENKILATLVNIEEERVKGGRRNIFEKTEDGWSKTNPPVYLNLYVLFSANFGANNYEEALRYITGVIGFFQSNNLFLPENHPGLENPADRLSAEIVSMDATALNNLWNTLGCKAMPCVMYRLRTISVQENMVTSKGSLIQKL